MCLFIRERGISGGERGGRGREGGGEGEGERERQTDGGDVCVHVPVWKRMLTKYAH